MWNATNAIQAAEALKALLDTYPVDRHVGEALYSIYLTLTGR